MRKLLATAERTPGMFTRNKYPMRKAAFWRALILVGYSTGLRLGDMERLAFDDIEPDGTLIVTQHKTGATIRCCLLPAAHEAVKAIRWPVRRLIFGGVICRRAYFDAFKEIVRAAGLTGTTKWLRRTSGTLVESIAPGRGHEQLGNGRKVFESHYLDQRQIAMTRPMPPGLVGKND